MKKTKIVVASVLKPIDDTRMFEKIGISLSQTNKYEINIIGFYSKKLPKPDNIIFHPIFNFKRLNISRLLPPVRFLNKLIQLKPELVIINTHELLMVTILYKILFGAKIIYDIRENYYRNIRYTKTFAYPLRPLLAGYVRGKEYLSRVFFDHYFLAESAYENEFTFSAGKSTIIENKYRPLALTSPPVKRPARSDNSTSNITIIFTGTLAESTGVFECIDLVKKLHKKAPEVRLIIAGYCSMSKTLKRLRQTIEKFDFIQLIGGHKLLSHHDILKVISKADFGVIYYPWNPSTMNTRPTKLFEYLGNHLPILLQDHKPWVDLATNYEAAIPIDLSKPDIDNLLQTMRSRKFYTTLPGEEILWISEEKKLIKVIDLITHNSL